MAIQRRPVANPISLSGITIHGGVPVTGSSSSAPSSAPTAHVARVVSPINSRTPISINTGGSSISPSPIINPGISSIMGSTIQQYTGNLAAPSTHVATPQQPISNRPTAILSHATSGLFR